MTGGVCGYVVLAQTLMPIAGATVVVRGARAAAEPDIAWPNLALAKRMVAALTDSAGCFTFDLRQGHWHLQAIGGPSGEHPLGEGTVHVFENALSELTIEVHSLPDAGWAPAGPGEVPGTGSVRGRILQADSGAPLADATITAVSADGAGLDLAPVSDAAGWFVLDGLSEGDWLLSAEGPMGESGTVRVQVAAGAVSDVTIEAVPARPATRRKRSARVCSKQERPMSGMVRGQVVRADSGEPISNASIMVVQGAGLAPDIAPLTDDSGAFALEGLPPGEWTLRALSPEGDSRTVTVKVSAGSTADVVIRIARSSGG